MRLLITGGAGYVGTRLANTLCRGGHHVRVLDALLYGSQGLRPEIELRRGDLCMRSDASRALEGVDIVFHLATVEGESGRTRDSRSLNIEGTRTLLREARRRRVRRFVFASSLDSAMNGKREAEHLVLEQNQPEFETVVVRKAAICGPSPRQRFDLGANAMVGSAYWDGRIVIPEDAPAITHLTMTDAIRLYLTLLESRGEAIAGQSFDAGFEPITPRELAERVCEQVPTPNGVPAAIEIHEGSNLARASCCDSRALEQRTGFRPEACLREMVDQLVQLMELGFLGRYDRDIYHNERARVVKPEAGRGFAFLQRAARAFPPSL